MNLTDFRNMQRRVERARNAVSKNESAEGFTQDLNVHPDEKLIVKGLKSPAELEDDILTLCVWIWSMKDYLKTLVENNDGNPQRIEEIATESDSLAVVADIANRAKHGNLSRSRTRNDDFAKLTNVGFVVDQTAVDSISFGRSGVTVDVGRPNDAELTAKIQFESGDRETIDNAFAVIEDAIKTWETEAYPLVAG